MESGTQLGPYEILEPLGAGGMGEVWLAEDSRLGRRVAIKVLPPSVAEDRDSLVRLEHEARVLAQLEHPNVAAVYGLERAQDGAGELLLVMQYAEGETLGHRIGGTGLAVDEALEIARQIAAGLGAAHDKGIIHRDLKPANVMLNEGAAGALEVKVLDFGLAKARTAREGSGGADMSASPTMAAMTADGLILGTAAYMSPEQARGKPLDSRTDVWAFGCVLFEMLSGRQAFAGETVSDVMAAILKEDPDWSRLPDETPASVLRALRRCLSKDPDRRPHDVRDVVLGFEEDEDATFAPQPVAPSRGRMAWVVGAATLAAGLALGYVLAGAGGAGPGEAIQPTHHRQLTTSVGWEASPHLSADGEWIVYASPADGDWDIYLLGVGGDNAINLTADEPADDTMPAFAPDGRSIAFRSERSGGGIYVMGRTGESVRRVSDRGYNPAWSPDGATLVVSTAAITDTPYERQSDGRLLMIDLEAARTRELDLGGQDAVQPAWSPDGARIVFWGLPSGGGRRDLWTVAAGGGEPARLTDDAATDWSPAWSHDGAAVIFSSDRGGTIGLWRIDVDPATGGPAGRPQLVVAGGGSEWLADPSVSAAGDALMYSATKSTVDVYRLDLAPDLRAPAAPPVRLTRGSRHALGPQLSPDGSSLVYQTGRGQQEDIFLHPLDGSPVTRLTNDAAKDRGTRFSPDGRRVSFYSDRSGIYEIYTISVDGGGVRPLLPSVQDTRTVAWSSDGARVVAGDREGTQIVIASSDPDSGEQPTRVATDVPPNHVYTVQGWSRDESQVLVGMVNFDDGVEMGVHLIDAASGTVTRLTPFGRYMAWLSDDRHIAFEDGKSLWLVDSQTGDFWPVLDVTPDRIINYISAAWDVPAIVYSQLTLQGDVWLATYPESP